MHSSVLPTCLLMPLAAQGCSCPLRWRACRFFNDVVATSQAGALLSLSSGACRLLPPVSAAFLSPGHRAGFHERGQTELLRAQLLGTHAAHARSRAAVEVLRVLLLLPFLRSEQIGEVARRLVTWPALIVAAHHSSCFLLLLLLCACAEADLVVDLIGEPTPAFVPVPCVRAPTAPGSWWWSPPPMT